MASIAGNRQGVAGEVDEVVEVPGVDEAKVDTGNGVNDGAKEKVDWKRAT